MALQIVTDSPFSTTNLSAAYAKVVGSPLLDYTNSFGRIHVEVFHDQASRQVEKEPVRTEIHAVVGDDFSTYFALGVLDSANPITKSYEYLKAKVPAYSGAVDV